MVHRLVKRLISGAIALTLVFSINGFAAVVTDNDGSAFITKAEFDSLKNQFQAQIDSYNQAIDSKIDGAIAAYLAGIKVGTELQNEWEKIKLAIGEPMWFANAFTVTGKSDRGKATIKAQRSITLARHHVYKASEFQSAVYAWTALPSYGWGLGVGIIKKGGSVSSTTNMANSTLVYGETAAVQPTVSTVLVNSGALSGTGGRALWADTNITRTENVIIDTSAKTQDGEGQVWLLRKRSDGTYTLDKYCSEYWPVQAFDIQYHTYLARNVGTNAANFRTWYGAENGLADTRGTDVSISNTNEYKTFKSGTKAGNGNTTSASTYYKLEQYCRSSNNGVNYEVKQYGTDVTAQIYAIVDGTLPTKASSQTSVARNDNEAKFYDVYYNKTGGNKQTNKLGGVGLKYYELSMSPIAVYPYQIVQTNITSLMGKTIKLGQGVPIATTIDQDRTVKLKFTLKERNSAGTETTSSTNATIKWEISDMPFLKGGIDSGSGAKSFQSGTAKPGEEIEVVCNLERPGTIWMNMYDTQTGYECTLNSLAMN